MTINNNLKSIFLSIKTSCYEIFNLLKEDEIYNHSKGYNINNSGDIQTKLDIKANEIFIRNLSNNKNIKYLASEESPDKIFVNNEGEFIVVFDPLDGSGNINVDLSLGSIFAILKNNPKSGRDIVFSGYCLYTYKCLMVYTFGDQKVLHENLVSKNISLLNNQKFIGVSSYSCINNKFKNFNNDIENKIKLMKNFRWTGCMVSDVHRIVKNTGIFCYPDEKLRILYECYPIAFLIINLGGESFEIDENYKIKNNILDILFPDSDIHKKSGIFITYPGNIISKI
jgi:fructose-1,6-bisphosphatase I